MQISIRNLTRNIAINVSFYKCFVYSKTVWHTDANSDRNSATVAKKAEFSMLSAVLTMETAAISSSSSKLT